MEHTAAGQRTTGLDLKLARVALGVPQREVARRLGVSPQRVSGIEATYRPTRWTCSRYLAALDAISPADPGQDDAGAPAGPLT